MADNKHCPDHCDMAVAIGKIEENLSYIRAKLDAQKTDGKWLFGTVIAVSSLLYTYFK